MSESWAPEMLHLNSYRTVLGALVSVIGMYIPLMAVADGIASQAEGLATEAVAGTVVHPALSEGTVPQVAIPQLSAPEFAAPEFAAPEFAAPELPELELTGPVQDLPVTATPVAAGQLTEPMTSLGVAPSAPDSTIEAALAFLNDGGPSIWAIAALSVLTLALILWKIWRFVLLGAWSKGRAYKAVAAFEAGEIATAKTIVAGRIGLRSSIVAAAISARMSRTDAAAREDTARIAKQRLAEANTGLRALELIATIAPLLGLLGTVLGMIAAFQALQESGSRADPSMLAGGIWEALLTTAAGMAVAIPASAALTWFEAVVDRLRRDSEDMCARVFVVPLADTRPVPQVHLNSAPTKSLAAE